MPPYSDAEIFEIISFYNLYNPKSENYTGDAQWSLESKLKANEILRYDLLFKGITLVGGVGLQLYREDILLITRLFSNSYEHGGKYVPALIFSHYIKYQKQKNIRFLIFTFNMSARLSGSIERKRSRNFEDKSYIMWKNTIDQFVKLSKAMLINLVLQDVYVHDLSRQPDELLKSLS